MLKIKYSLGHPRQEFMQLAAVVGGTVAGNRWSYDNAVGKGYMEYHELDEGLLLYVYEYEFFQPILITRQPTVDNTYFIINYDVSGVDISVDASRPFNEFGANHFDGVFFASSKTAASFQQAVNKPSSGIKIVFHKSWIEKYACPDDATEKEFIRFILDLQLPIHLFEYMDTPSLHLVREIFSSRQQPSFLKIKLISCTVNLLQTFFTRIVNREHKLYRDFHYTDLGNIFEARELLIADFTLPCPKIDELTKVASMSESKFTKLFKQVFGQPFYQYYQTSRMMKAHHLLESGKFSVQEVSGLVGYQHPGKFSQAFKKQFNRSPKEVRH